MTIEDRGNGEPEHTCAAPHCRRRPTRGQLCEADASRLGQWLADVGDDWHRLDPAPSAASWAPDRTGGSSLASERAPARLDVLVLTDHRSRPRDEQEDPDGNRLRSLPEVLGSWAATVRDERGLAATRGYDVHGDRRLLVAHLEWVLGQPWVDELYADVRDVWAQLKAATGQRTGQRPVRACPALVGTPPARCGGPVWLDKDCAYCGACGTAWSGFELVRLTREPAA